MTAITTTPCGCGGRCGGACGGSASSSSAFALVATTGAFARPHFFAGQLLTDDDLEQLIRYVSGKQRLRNRILFGSGVVAGLDVVCDPCGGGNVVIRPGFALDCCGNEIVVACPETVPVTELIRDLRNRGLGADCGDPCADPAHHAITAGSETGSTENTGTTSPGQHSRRYGLYLRYAEVDAEPVSPYSTQEPCPPAGCVASRIREGFSVAVACAPTESSDHLYRPGDRLLAALGDRPGRVRDAGTIWSRARVVSRYRERMRAAAAAADAPGRVIVLTDRDAQHFARAVPLLQRFLAEADIRMPPAGPPKFVPSMDASEIDLARQMTEVVRALAAVIARFDLYSLQDQETLRRVHTEFGAGATDQVEPARQLLETACQWLTPAVETPPTSSSADPAPPVTPDLVWPDPVSRAVARAVVRQTAEQVVATDGRNELGRRMVALGSPLDRDLRSQLRRWLRLLREWLLVRLESSPDVAVCDLRRAVAAIITPSPLPDLPEDATDDINGEELRDLARIADAIYDALHRFIADRACAALIPPAPTCTDSDVLLAVVEIDDCEVLGICTAGREQVVPGGGAYGAWYDQLPQLRRLAEKVCCRPVPKETFVLAPPLGDAAQDPDGEDDGEPDGESEGEMDGKGDEVLQGISLAYLPDWLVPGTDGSPLETLIAALGVATVPQPAPAQAPPSVSFQRLAEAPVAAAANHKAVQDLRREVRRLTSRLAKAETSAAQGDPATATGSTPAEEASVAKDPTTSTAEVPASDASTKAPTVPEAAAEAPTKNAPAKKASPTRRPAKKASATETPATKTSGTKTPAKTPSARATSAPPRRQAPPASREEDGT